MKFGQGKVRSVKNHGISLRTKSGHPVLDKVPRQQFFSHVGQSSLSRSIISNTGSNVCTSFTFCNSKLDYSHAFIFKHIVSSFQKYW